MPARIKLALRVMPRTSTSVVSEPALELENLSGLGKRKARSAGKITLNDLVNQSGRPVTLLRLGADERVQ